MKTETEYGLAMPSVTQPAANAPKPGVSFADTLKASVEAERKRVLGAQPEKPANPNADEIAKIREHGMPAYVEEVHKKKIEELHAKILEKMGLSEEDLDAMPPEHRKTVEDMISREIAARTAIDSMTNGGGNETGTVADGAHLAAQAIAGEAGRLPGGAAGFAIMTAMDAEDGIPLDFDPERRLPV
ncbi:MAG: hypothetical protein VW338_04885 [Rhodospirillaceae bacterium]